MTKTGLFAKLSALLPGKNFSLREPFGLPEFMVSMKIDFFQCVNLIFNREDLSECRDDERPMPAKMKL
jgi:hypothetical protein